MGLTQRESEALALVVRGLRNQEIADALFLGVNTVKTHLKSLYRKLGARNRAEAVALALADGAFRPGPVAEHS
jgi:DNA-binding CsgD family transcriptional regulator